MSTRAAGVTLVAGLALVAGPPPARADNPYLREARAHKLALDYRTARESLRQAYELGNNQPAELAEIFRLRGEVEAGLGNLEAATDAFDRLLALEPDAALPPGTSPKLAAPFAAAHQRAAGRAALAIHHEVTPGPGVVLVIDADPLAMVAGAAASYRHAAGAEPVVIEAMGRGRIPLPLPPTDRLALVLWAFDEYGNRLAVIGSDADPLVVTAPSTAGDALGASQPRPEPRAKPALYARWYPWAGLAVVSAAAATYFGFEVQAAERELADLNLSSTGHDYSEAEAIAQRGRRNAWVANLGFAVAGAAAVTSAVLWIRDPRRHRDRRPALVVGPAITGGGAGGFVAFGF